jgi:Mitochondrial morphogenesis regulator
MKSPFALICDMWRCASSLIVQITRTDHVMLKCLLLYWFFCRVVERQGQPSHLAASPNNVTVIREVYENGSAMEYFAMQLDFALDSGVNTIIIEPSRLGRETTQWLRIGCFLRRMALVSGSASIIAGAFGQDSACLPLGTLAGIASTVYIASWRPDPCALYRVERNVQQLQRLPLPEVSCTQPVVLVRCNRMRLKNGLHDSVSAAALAVCLWRLYRWYYN